MGLCPILKAKLWAGSVIFPTSEVQPERSANLSYGGIYLATAFYIKSIINLSYVTAKL